MYNFSQLLYRYFQYWLRAANGKGHGIHSPFVFTFITKVMNDKTVYPDYLVVESLRNQLASDLRVLLIDDFGAGSVYADNNKRSIKSIAQHATKPRKYAQLIYRIARQYNPATILELGTSLGITTSYLSLAAPNAKIVTMEGSSSIAEVAKVNFEQLGLENIRLIEGDFEDTLSPYLSETGIVDFAFIDGNHRKEPTLRYFQQLLPHAGNDSVFIFDDIHWSKEMEESWAQIRKHPSVRCSIDLFFIGVIVFRKEFKEPQHFDIRF